MTIQRWRPTVTNVSATAYCGAHPEGEYVLATDYAALSAERDRLAAELADEKMMHGDCSRALVVEVKETHKLRAALTHAVEYIEADSSERFAELAEWKQLATGGDLAVTCARCGAPGTSATFVIEEGDEWECPACWERCEAKERGMVQPGEGRKP